MAKARSIIDGLKYGALFGLLFGSSIGFSYWSMSTMYLNAGAMITDILLTTVVVAVVALVIVLTWGKYK